jgi:hypothetical protein
MYITNIVRGPSNLPYQQTLLTVSGEQRNSLSVNIPTGTTNFLVKYTYNINSGVFLALSSNFDGYPLTVKTNNQNSPTNTIIVKSNDQKFFYQGNNLDSNNAALQNITQLFVNNTGNRSITLNADGIIKY